MPLSLALGKRVQRVGSVQIGAADDRVSGFASSSGRHQSLVGTGWMGRASVQRLHAGRFEFRNLLGRRGDAIRRLMGKNSSLLRARDCVLLQLVARSTDSAALKQSALTHSLAICLPDCLNGWATQTGGASFGSRSISFELCLKSHESWWDQKQR